MRHVQYVHNQHIGDPAGAGPSSTADGEVPEDEKPLLKRREYLSDREEIVHDEDKLRRKIPCCGFEYCVALEFFVLCRMMYLDYEKGTADNDGNLTEDKLYLYWIIDATSIFCGLVFALTGAYMDTDVTWFNWPIDDFFWAIDNILILALISGSSYAIVLEDGALPEYRVAIGTASFIFLTMSQSFLFRTVLAAYKFSSCGWLWYKLQRLLLVLLVITYGVWGFLHDLPDQELLFVTCYLTFTLEMYFTCNRLDSSDSMSLSYGNMVSKFAIHGDNQWAVSRHDADGGYNNAPEADKDKP